MQIILLEKIPKLGDVGEQVSVKMGYARNFLIPYGKAVTASKKNIEYFEIQRVKQKMQLIDVQSAVEIKAKKINELNKITILAKASKEGKLFGSVGARDIANAITAAGVNITKNEVKLANGVLRTIGNHNVNIQIHHEISVNMIINIITK